VPQPGECFGALAPDGDALELDAGPGSDARGTLVVNCANANSGRAAWLEHGAAIIHYNPTAPAAATVAATVAAADVAADVAAAATATPDNSAAASAAPAPVGSASTLAATASSAAAAAAATATPASGVTVVEPSAASAAAAASASDSAAPADAAAPREQVLLAIDLGLKSGAALYDGRGALLRYAPPRLLPAAQP
jgi:hypothetical protein